MTVDTALYKFSMELFDTTRGIRDGNINSSAYNIESNSIYSINIQVPFTETEHVIPVVALEHVMDIYDKATGDLKFPLYGYGLTTLHVRTTSSLISKMADNSSSAVTRLHGIDTSNNDRYMFGSGIVLDSDGMPLMLTTLRCSDWYDADKYDVSDPVIMVHPSVFCSNGIFEKALVRHILPYIFQNGIRIYGRNVTRSMFTNSVVPKIVISSDIESYICKPVHRSIDNDAINKVIKSNVDRICRTLP